METIDTTRSFKDIFKEMLERPPENIIKTVQIDWKKHAWGVIEILTMLEPKFKLTESNQKILKLLLMYFTGNPLFSDYLNELTGVEGSLSKGIWLFGKVGCGKTLLLKAFKQYTGKIIHRNSFHFINEIDIVNEIMTFGSEKLTQYSYNEGRPKVMLIDDFGSFNQKIKHYGNEIEVMANLLTTRYVIFTQYKKLTHISTNFAPNDIRNYDLRIIDRFAEMFNIVELNGDSFR
jgi:hypothetical protein